MINSHFRQFSMGVFALFLLAGKGYAQVGASDSLELVPLIGKVIKNYPTVQQATETLNASD